jgi:hypothetical protein
MLSVPPRVQVFASLTATDMRKSFDGLVGIVEKELRQSIESGQLFLFFNRRRDRVKLLYFTGDGLVIFYKKLEVGTFEQLRAPSSDATGPSETAAAVPCLTLRGRELALLLDGIDLASVKRRKWWQPPTPPESQ